jgi:hypothetical protein
LNEFAGPKWRKVKDRNTDQADRQCEGESSIKRCSELANDDRQKCIDKCCDECGEPESDNRHDSWRTAEGKTDFERRRVLDDGTDWRWIVIRVCADSEDESSEDEGNEEGAVFPTREDRPNETN